MNKKTLSVEKNNQYTKSIIGEIKNFKKYFHTTIKYNGILLEKKTFNNIFDAQIQLVNWDIDYKIGKQYKGEYLD